VEEKNILKVELLFDSSYDDGFKSIVENKLKAIDLKGLTKAVTGLKVGEDFKLENKQIEENFIRYGRHLLGETISGTIPNIMIKFKEEYLMEVYLSN
jgi:hypothetical protein